MAKAIDINGITGEVIERELNAAEIETRKFAIQKQKIRLQNETAKNEVKQAVLEKLGLTADEAAALFG
jgi:hypothetical protein